MLSGKWWGRIDVQPIIGIHGWEDNAGTFDTLAPLLEVDSFLAIDLPGHGLSSHYPSGKQFVFTDAVITLRYIVRHYNWKNVSLIGHSFGSATSFVYAAFFPDEVDKYIGIECARVLMNDSITKNTLMYKFTDNLIKTEVNIKKGNPPNYSYDEIIQNMSQGNRGSLTNKSCEILLRRGMLPSQNKNGFYFSRDPRLRFHSWANLTEEHVFKYSPQIKCKVLSITAPYNPVFGEGYPDRYKRSLDLIRSSASKLDHFEVSGTHHVHLNNPERVAPLINRFWTS